MKIVIAKQSNKNRIGYINASNIESFYADVNPYNERLETKIYLVGGVQSIIDGDKTKELCEFLSSDAECGVLDFTTESEKKSFWEKRDSNGKAD